MKYLWKREHKYFSASYFREPVNVRCSLPLPCCLLHFLEIVCCHDFEWLCVSARVNRMAIRTVVRSAALWRLSCGDHPGCCWKCLKSKAIITCSQHGLIKRKSCLNNLTSFYKKVTCLAAEGFTCLEQTFCWTGSFHLKHHDLESLKCKENVL